MKEHQFSEGQKILAVREMGSVADVTLMGRRLVAEIGRLCTADSRSRIDQILEGRLVTENAQKTLAEIKRRIADPRSEFIDLLPLASISLGWTA